MGSCFGRKSYEKKDKSTQIPEINIQNNIVTNRTDISELLELEVINNMLQEQKKKDN